MTADVIFGIPDTAFMLGYALLIAVILVVSAWWRSRNWWRRSLPALR